MKEYFIKLKPLNSFYYGSIESFEDKNKKKYFLKSNIYPQQTAILGMLRKKILEDNGILVPKNKRDARQLEREKEYIGEIKSDFSESNFGMIERISPVQIYVEDIPYYFLYKESERDDSLKEKFSDEKNLTNKKKKYLFEYNSKKISEFFQAVSDGKIKSKDSLLRETVDIGISKFKKNEAFFKKQRYVFKESNTYFGFYTTLKDEIILKNGFIQLGDRHSIFQLEVIAKEKEEEKDISNLYGNEKRSFLFATSDMYIQQEELKKILDLSEGIFMHNKKFKFISRDNKRRYSSNESIQNMIGRGSLFLLDEKNEILKFLENEKYRNYRKIGLNNYFIIKKGENLNESEVI